MKTEKLLISPYNFNQLVDAGVIKSKYYVNSHAEIETELSELRIKCADYEKALEFYADLLHNHILIFDNENDSRAEVYEKYKQHSIGDLGVSAYEVLAKYKTKSDEGKEK